jgi:alkanesulfonate monooxygenase
MSEAHFHWFNPIKQDSRDLAPTKDRARVATPEYRADVVRTAERLGFESILYMVGAYCNDPWLAAAAQIPQTEKIKFIVAVRPGYIHPAVAAEMVQSFQELSNNRLWLNIVTASHEAELRAHGDFLDKDARYERTDEFVNVLKRAWEGTPFSHEGKHYRVENGGLSTKLAVEPKLFSGGSSGGGVQVGAKHAHVHLSYGEPPPLAAERVKEVSEEADKHGRKVEFGVRMHVIARETSAEAWRETDRLLERLDPAVIERQQKIINARVSVGQARVQALNTGHKNDPEALKIYPNIWSGTGLVSAGGGSTALVGSYAEVAERIEEYLSVGVEHFLISGYPLLESAYEFAEGVMPYFQNRATKPVLTVDREAAA